jgi:hypothetical protein
VSSTFEYEDDEAEEDEFGAVVRVRKGAKMPPAAKSESGSSTREDVPSDDVQVIDLEDETVMTVLQPQNGHNLSSVSAEDEDRVNASLSSSDHGSLSWDQRSADRSHSAKDEVVIVSNEDNETTLIDRERSAAAPESSDEEDSALDREEASVDDDGEAEAASHVSVVVLGDDSEGIIRVVDSSSSFPSRSGASSDVSRSMSSASQASSSAASGSNVARVRDEIRSTPSSSRSPVSIIVEGRIVFECK